MKKVDFLLINKESINHTFISFIRKFDSVTEKFRTVFFSQELCSRTDVSPNLTITVYRSHFVSQNSQNNVMA